jgi:hypothetical protein
MVPLGVTRLGIVVVLEEPGVEEVSSLRVSQVFLGFLE